MSEKLEMTIEFEEGKFLFEISGANETLKFRLTPERVTQILTERFDYTNEEFEE